MSAPSSARSPLEENDPARARVLKAKILDRINDLSRHLIALRVAMSEFGEDFELTPFQNAYRSEDPVELNRVKAVERGVDLGTAGHDKVLRVRGLIFMASTSSLLTRREAAEIGRVPLNAIDKAIEQGVVKPKRSKGKPLLPAHEVALLVLLRQIDVTLPNKTKGRLRNWLAHLQPQAVGSEFAVSEALRVAMTADVAQTIERAESYARLRDRYVERNPAVMGGEPVIAGTRVPVRTIASLIEMGETHETLREDYPHIPEEAYPVAVPWTHANPRRGRPAAPWDAAASRPARQFRATRSA